MERIFRSRACAYALAAASVISILGLAGCTAQASLPSYSTVPSFTLTDQDGKTFNSASVLDGHVWIADFMYTTCPGPCPRMSSQMRQIQTSLGSKDVRLISLTVDPAHDTPQVLAQYAQHYSAKPGVWYFLTGPAATLQHLDRDVFHLGDVDGSLEHSTRFILVDRKSRVRGFYLTSEKDAIDRVIEDAKRLLREPS